MSDTTNNPFESPKTDMDEIKGSVPTGELTDRMQTYLIEASPWIRFIGILGYVGAGGMFSMGLMVSVGMAVFGRNISEGTEMTGLMTGLMGAGFGAMYIIFGILYFFPAHFTFKFGSGIKTYKDSGLNKDMEVALKNNKSLWKFIGILSIISLSLIPVGIIASIIIGVAAAF